MKHTNEIRTRVCRKIVSVDLVLSTISRRNALQCKQVNDGDKTSMVFVKWCEAIRSDFQSFTVLQLMYESFSYDMTHFNIYANAIACGTTSINNIKCKASSFSEHIIISPCFLHFNDIYMPHRNCHTIGKLRH